MYTHIYIYRATSPTSATTATTVVCVLIEAVVSIIIHDVVVAELLGVAAYKRSVAAQGRSRFVL